MNLDNYKEIQVDTIGGGSLPEMFDRELKKIIKDIKDVNKLAKKHLIIKCA